MTRRVLLVVAAIACLSVAGLGQSVQTYFASPVTGDGIRSVLVQSIDSAKQSLDVAVSSFTDEVLGDAVLRAARRGVDVRVLVGRATIRDQAERLEGAGVSVRCTDEIVAFGHRFAVVDQRIVLAGSYDWSAPKTPITYDAMVRIVYASPAQATAAQAFLVEFERLWARWSSGVVAGSTDRSAISSVSILSVDRAAQCVYLLNASASAIDVSGWTLNDLEGQYVFPSGTTLPSNEAFRICIDAFNPTHDVDALFLDPDGDELFLSTPQGDIVDEVVW